MNVWLVYIQPQKEGTAGIVSYASNKRQPAAFLCLEFTHSLRSDYRSKTWLSSLMLSLKISRCCALKR